MHGSPSLFFSHNVQTAAVDFKSCMFSLENEGK